MQTEENQTEQTAELQQADSVETVTLTAEQVRNQSFALSILTTTLLHLLEEPYAGVVIANQGQLFIVYKNNENLVVVSPVTDNQQLAPGSKVTLSAPPTQVDQQVEETK